MLRAQKEIHELATKINHIEQEAGFSEQMQQRLREIEAIIDGLDDVSVQYFRFSFFAKYIKLTKVAFVKFKMVQGQSQILKMAKMYLFFAYFFINRFF